MGCKITGVVLWVAALILITIMATINVEEVKTFDLSGIQAGQIIAGTNHLKPDFEVSSVTDFTAKHYSLVMAGVKNSSRGELTLLGLSGGKYYQTNQTFPLGALQNVKEVRVIDRTINITCGKDGGSIAGLITLSVIIFGLFGALFWTIGEERERLLK